MGSADALIMNMLFRERLKADLEPTLLKFGFQPIDRDNRFVEYCSNSLALRFVFDTREQSSNFFIGTSSDDLILFDNDILLNVYGSSVRIDQVPIENFIDGLRSFFENEGLKLMLGSGSELRRAYTYQEERSKAYTSWIQGKEKGR